MKKKQPTTIDQAYVTTLCQAALTHAAAAPMAKRLGDILGLLAAAEVRRPDDWQFQFNGPVSLRWFDAPQYSGSQRYCRLDVLTGLVEVHGRMEKTYDSQGGITIRGMREQDAVAVLKILVGMIDKERSNG